MLNYDNKQRTLRYFYQHNGFLFSTYLSLIKLFTEEKQKLIAKFPLNCPSHFAKQPVRFPR